MARCATGDLIETVTLAKRAADQGNAYHVSSYEYAVAYGSLWRLASTGEVLEQIAVPSALAIDFARSGKLGLAPINADEWFGLSDSASNFTLYRWKAQAAFGGGRELTLRLANQHQGPCRFRRHIQGFRALARRQPLVQRRSHRRLRHVEFSFAHQQRRNGQSRTL